MLNFILVVIGAIGVFLIVSTIFGFFDTKEKIISAVGGELKELDLKGKLETLLYQAHAPIAPQEFLMISLAIGVGLALAAFLVTGGLIVSFVLLFAGGFIYYLYLLERRDKLILVYEETMPLAIIIIKEYLRVHGANLVGALEEVATEGPEILKEDFWDLSVAFQHPVSIDMSIVNRILTYRNSPSLAKIVELLMNYSGVEMTMMYKALDELQTTVQKEVDIAAENEAIVMGPKRNLLFICGIVVGVAIILIVGSPIIRAIYATFVGQMTLLAALSITVGMYYIGRRAATKASMTRPYTITFPEQRNVAPPSRSFTPDTGDEEA